MVRPGGSLVVVRPGPNHLLGLKAALYAEARKQARIIIITLKRNKYTDYNYILEMVSLKMDNTTP